MPGAPALYFAMQLGKLVFFLSFPEDIAMTNFGSGSELLTIPDSLARINQYGHGEGETGTESEGESEYILGYILLVGITSQNGWRRPAYDSSLIPGGR